MTSTAEETQPSSPVQGEEDDEGAAGAPPRPGAELRSAAEYPTGETTGVPAGTALTPSDSVVVTEHGTVLDSLHVRGSVVVRANDVVIRRTLVDSHGKYPIKVDHGVRNLVVEDTEIDGNGVASVAILWDNYTLRRVNVHDVRDGPRIEGPDVVIEDSYVHHLTRVPGGHHDAIQVRQGSNIVIRGNNLQAYNASTGDLMNAAIQVGSLVGPLSGMLVEGNLLNGGNFTLNPGGDAVEAAYHGNLFERQHRYGAVRGVGDRTEWSNTNVWADTGEPIRD